MCAYVCISSHTYMLTEKHTNIPTYMYIFVLLKRKWNSCLEEKKKIINFNLQLIYHGKNKDSS